MIRRYLLVSLLFAVLVNVHHLLVLAIRVWCARRACQQTAVRPDGWLRDLLA